MRSSLCLGYVGISSMMGRHATLCVPRFILTGPLSSDGPMLHPYWTTLCILHSMVHLDWPRFSLIAYAVRSDRSEFYFNNPAEYCLNHHVPQDQEGVGNPPTPHLFAAYPQRRDPRQSRSVASLSPREPFSSLQGERAPGDQAGI